MRHRPKTTPIAERVLLLRDAGVVKRSHTCRTLVDRNVAEHSHGVAMLIVTLWVWEGLGAPPGNLLAAALSHDLSELSTGDIPAPVKRGNPDLKRLLNKISTVWEENMEIRFELPAEQAALLLWCDRVDFALYALEEVTMGNRFFVEYLTRIADWICEMPIPTIQGKNEATLSLYQGVMDLVLDAVQIAYPDLERKIP